MRIDGILLPATKEKVQYSHSAGVVILSKNGPADWLLRFLKGMLIGSGFILPGVSGGALAAVFGIYERMIGFLAHPLKNFRGNIIYFLPVGLGGAAGVFALSFAVSFFLGAYEAQILWLFVGCIVGTLPTLWRQAGRYGRDVGHVAVLAVAMVAGYAVLQLGAGLGGEITEPGLPAWLGAGALIGLGTVIPGLSPSNFLVYLGLYVPMADGIKALNLQVILPLGVGAAACVLLLSRLMDALFARAHALLSHLILGVVAASTAMIIPAGVNYFSLGGAACILACAAGILLGLRMGALESAHKQE